MLVAEPSITEVNVSPEMENSTKISIKQDKIERFNVKKSELLKEYEEMNAKMDAIEHELKSLLENPDGNPVTEELISDLNRSMVIYLEHAKTNCSELRANREIVDRLKQEIEKLKLKDA